MKTTLAATLVALTVANATALTLTIPNNVLGKVTPATPAGDAFSEEQIRFLADEHNTPKLPGNLGDNPNDGGPEVYTLVTQFGIQLDETINMAFKSDSSDNSLSELGQYDYVLAKYGSDAVIWYIGNLVQDGTITVPNKYEEFVTVNLPNGRTREDKVFGGGLSHLSFYNERTTKVPDGGATAALLGLGVLGLAAMKRKK